MEYVTEALRIVKDADTKSILTDRKEVVLVLGCTGAGKSTLTHFIGNNCNLSAKKVGNNHLIVDDENRINASIMSHTIYPECVYNQTDDTAFYDCGGFNDTRSAAHDIASTYLIKRVIDYADRIKIILVISYSSVQEGADREGLMQLLRHVVTLIKDVGKFKASIALVVTKVYELEEVEPEKFQHIQTETIIENVCAFLVKVKEVFPALKPETGHYYSDEYKKLIVRLIDILLIKDDNDVHQRIGIFRKPTKPGPLNEQCLLQQCKSQISTVIFKNLKFTKKNDDDFGYTISDAARNQIHEIVEVLNTIFSDMSVFGKEFTNHLTSVEQENQNDLYKISETMFKAYKMLEDFIAEITEHCSPIDFYQRFISILKNNNVESLHHSFTVQLQAAKYFDYLQTISKTKLTMDTFSWTRQLSLIKNYAQAQNEVIKFLIVVFEKLSAYDFEEFAAELRDYDKFAECVSLTKIDYKCNLPIEPKYKLFQNVLHQTMKHAIKYSTENGLLKITGFNLRLSEVHKEIPREILNEARNIKIFSLNKVYIDDDLSEIGKKMNLVIIAPTWEIIGNPKINLSGSDGVRYKEAAECGSYPGGRGANGRDGKNGIDAGNCMLVGGNFINGKALHILANGGNGGKGQNGGVGGQGECGKDARSVINAENLPPDAILQNSEDDGGWSYVGRIVTLGANSQNITETYTIPGQRGLNGGVGGKGGNGGVGGQCGLVTVIATDQGPDFVVSQNVGTAGPAGIVGRDGPQGSDGDSFDFKLEKKLSTSVLFIPMEPTIVIKKFFKLSGGLVNRIRNRDPTEIEENEEEVVPIEVNEDFVDSTDSFFRRSCIEYKQYVADNKESSLSFGKLSAFINKIKFYGPVDNSAIIEN